jgi:hypothetical protein
MPVDETVSYLGPDQSSLFFEKVLPTSEGGQAIWAALEEQGFAPLRTEGNVLDVYSPDSGRSIAIGVIPFLAKDRSRSAGVSVSQGGYAKAVSVETLGGEPVRFTTYDFVDGNLRTEDFDSQQLVREGYQRFSEHVEVVRSERPLVELSVKQVLSMTELVYSGPGAKEYPSGVLASELSLLVLAMTSASPGCSSCSTCGCCCSCCCSCCW